MRVCWLFGCTSNKCVIVIVPLSFCGFDVHFIHLPVFLLPLQLRFWMCFLSFSFSVRSNRIASNSHGCATFLLCLHSFFIGLTNDDTNEVKKIEQANKHAIIISHTLFSNKKCVCVYVIVRLKNKMMLILNVNHQQNEKLPHKLMQINLFYFIQFDLLFSLLLFYNRLVSSDNSHDLTIKMMPENRELPNYPLSLCLAGVIKVLISRALIQLHLAREVE